ncbi:MAG: RagB/SusD family nutrient uptake outer membrane protein [Prevotella sp.]|nr:RagB/SusD family nutrient uptake outer membrane protein [Prevotella sp.]
MKLKSIIAPSLILGSLMFAVTSCGDFFDQDSEQVIYADKGHLGNATDTIYSVTGILDKLQNLSDRTILLGELRGDLMDINSTTSSDLRDIALFQIGDSNVYNSPRDYYAVINNCNYFIAKVDTALKNNRNEYIFMREYAAVKAFRAWTYLQLVINYGRVPFVTEPILSKEEADRDHATKDIREVCDYLIADIAPYADIETPNYGEIRNTDSKLFYFPIYILLGDLNLWAGHYKEAAVAYYKYLSTRNGAESAYPTSINCSRWYNVGSNWQMTNDSWSANMFMSESMSQNGELITMIPGDSIPSEGNYSELRNIFNSSSDNNYKVSAQPSQRIIEISAAQKYCDVSYPAKKVVYAPEGLQYLRTGDLRLFSVWNSPATGLTFMSDGKIITDFSSLVKYSSRNVHIYRRTMVYLRLAEALNRAGYPRFAFQILKRGLNNSVIEEHVLPYYPESEAWIRQFDFPNLKYVLLSDYDADENTMGIHSRGSGRTDVNEYYEMPDDTLETDPAVRLNYQIEKVEDLIMQEEALEFAFEGYRFYDLMRVALRRNDPSYLADKVYQRKGAENVGVMRAAIRCDLTDTRNWYLNWNDKIGLGY